ncbi:50S ribosomal protein L1 [Buchnera aphidicola]|uniref:Large ribosomal subunit protein uL1 n=2 Tax=Buchnera aphidicola TaxID=9 RepID=RL1_BUCA5|nr:50S ribosomal protein L1 [Buchnera aphidicola]B8D6V3.1 RecName: Full=Large ribosomal subunit protein uL1; AltName: Full=50S ribosomal protein L1 [Buchnera aphidicola str. Tuc7 (Acyrthosiphon pisum)]B8D8J9.1 RecName: Full=Large ribosomal subunit protein uL1; AltName: Full=50S ribosomal protein L1 [Buchnera aphidicola str. 5A (Acyrthosiphon pisum)]ADP66441.1 50S ribosomal protein L1 [Buchnera aphidicola str. TLW03 (Acyrthosiphon pisum)]ADP67603.1 50S ribosomal protein L1 [Buchnera aphidicola s
MNKKTKRMKKIKEHINFEKLHHIDETIDLLKKSSTVKFNESIDIAINLGINSKKSDQNIRSSTVLPNGIGRSIRVAVFTQGDNIAIAKDAGAELIGMEDLSEKIKKEGVDFDVVIATPDAMKIVTQLGQILGPRNLMPNTKLGTITTNIAEAIKNAKTGQVRYRNDKNGIIHATIGRINFHKNEIKENLNVFLESIKKAKPPQSKGIYIKKIVLSTTMGVGLMVDQSTLSL